MKSAIGDMVYRMGKEENRGILFFYAGHGETESLADGTRMGYIIPADCPLLKTNPMRFADYAISMRDIESASLRIQAKHVLMLFDSCFSGALFSLVRAVPDDISEKSTLPVRQYITAGREDEQVPDKSMFKRCLMIGLEGDADLTGDGYVTGSELGMYLSDRVVNYTRTRQHPQYGKINNPSLDRGDFVFIPLKTLEIKAKEEQIWKEEVSLLRDVEQLRRERAETQKLLEEMRFLLQERVKAEKDAKTTVAEKEALQNRLVGLQKEKESMGSLAETMAREYEVGLAASRKGIEREAAKKKALEKELEKLQQEKMQSEARFAASEKRIREEADRKKVLEEELKRLREARETVEAIRKTETGRKAREQAEAEKKPDTVRKVEKQIASLHVPEAKPVKKTTFHKIDATKPKKGTSTLIITSNKGGAEVFMDKKEISFWADPDEAWISRGTVPFRLDGISPGKHEIRVYLLNHGEELRVIDCKPGETVELPCRSFRTLLTGAVMVAAAVVEAAVGDSRHVCSSPSW